MSMNARARQLMNFLSLYTASLTIYEKCIFAAGLGGERVAARMCIFFFLSLIEGRYTKQDLDIFFQRGAARRRTIYLGVTQ